MTSTERETGMGYVAGTTAGRGITELDRHKLTGQVIDANVIRSIIAIALALRDLAAELGAATWEQRAAGRGGEGRGGGRQWGPGWTGRERKRQHGQVQSTGPATTLHTASGGEGRTARLRASGQ